MGSCRLERRGENSRPPRVELRWFDHRRRPAVSTYPRPGNSAPENMPQGGEALPSTHTRTRSSRANRSAHGGPKLDVTQMPTRSGADARRVDPDGGARQVEDTLRCAPALGASPGPSLSTRPDAKDTRSFQARAPRGHARPVLGDGGPGSDYRGHSPVGGAREPWAGQKH